LSQAGGNYNSVKEQAQKSFTPNSVLSTLKNNPNKLYMMTFEGKSVCNFLFIFNCTTESHVVVPYRVEGNKIYIWDTNVPYPFLIKDNQKKYAYEQYIVVDTQNNTFAPSDRKFYDWHSFDSLFLVSLDDFYNV
jgi:hypothetical protein